MISSGFEPATFRLVAQSLNLYTTACPLNILQVDLHNFVFPTGYQLPLEDTNLLRLRNLHFSTHPHMTTYKVHDARWSNENKDTKGTVC
jgi:hypothetical protein